MTRVKVNTSFSNPGGFVQFGVPYEDQLWGYRALVILLPIAVFLVTRHVCVRLRDGGEHPARDSGARLVERPRESGRRRFNKQDGGTETAWRRAPK